MRRFFLDTINENKAIMFKLPRHEGKTYYSIYALLSYLSKIKPNRHINNPTVAFISSNQNVSNHNRGMLADISLEKFSNDLKLFEPVNSAVNLHFKTKCKIQFYNQYNYRLEGCDYDLIVLDEFPDFEFKNQDTILNITSHRNSKVIMNGDESKIKFPFSVKTFYDMSEFNKRLSLNRKLKKIKSV